MESCVANIPTLSVNYCAGQNCTKAKKKSAALQLTSSTTEKKKKKNYYASAFRTTKLQWQVRTKAQNDCRAKVKINK